MQDFEGYILHSEVRDFFVNPWWEHNLVLPMDAADTCSKPSGHLY